MSFYSKNQLQADWDADNRAAAREAEEAAERHDAFLAKLADDEYWHSVRGAKAIHDHECGSAVDKFGHGSVEHCAVIDAANAKFDATVAEARIAKRNRIIELRANDAKRDEETHVVVGDHDPEIISNAELAA